MCYDTKDSYVLQNVTLCSDTVRMHRSQKLSVLQFCDNLDNNISFIVHRWWNPHNRCSYISLWLLYWHTARAKSGYESISRSNILILHREAYENFLMTIEFLKVLVRSLIKEKLNVSNTNSEYLLCLVKKCFDYIFLCSGGALWRGKLTHFSFVFILRSKFS